MRNSSSGSFQGDGVNILGGAGMALWALVVLLREAALPMARWARWLIAVLPNVGAAWAFTMFAKWLIVGVLNKPYTKRLHVLVCVAVLLLALGSEVVHDWFLGAAFDQRDIIATVIASAVMAVVGLFQRPPRETA